VLPGVDGEQRHGTEGGVLVMGLELFDDQSAADRLPREDAPTRTLHERRRLTEVGAEGIEGGFSAVYDVLKAMEDAGRIRRGYFVGGVGAMQFALPAALELMRSFKNASDDVESVVVSATDPANPYGTMLKWPAPNAADSGAGRGPTRTVGALVILVDGALAGYVARGGRQLLTFVPEDEPARTTTSRALATRLAAIARGEDGRGGLLVSEINGIPTSEHPLAPFLIDAGFNASAMGFQMRKAVGSAAGFASDVPALAIAQSEDDDA